MVAATTSKPKARARRRPNSEELENVGLRLPADLKKKLVREGRPPRHRNVSMLVEQIVAKALREREAAVVPVDTPPEKINRRPPQGDEDLDRTTFTLPLRQAKRLRDLAASQGRSMGWVLTEIIQAHYE